MAYTTYPWRETAAHVESRTWKSGDQELRVHMFRCKACGGIYMYSNVLYKRCPFCGAPIIHHTRKAS